MIPADRSVPRTPTILKTLGYNNAADHSALRALAILKIFEFRPAGLHSHILAGSKVLLFHAGMTDMTFGALVS